MRMRSLALLRQEAGMPDHAENGEITLKRSLGAFNLLASATFSAS